MKPRSLIIVFGVAVILFIAVMIARARLTAAPGELVQEAIRNSLNHSEAGTSTTSSTGTTWEDIVNLTNNAAESLSQQFNGFQIGAGPSNRIHAAFRDNRLNAKIEEVYYKRYNGTAWEPEKKISNIAALVSLGALEKLNVGGPAIAVSPSSGDVHIVWSFSVVNSLMESKVIKPRKIYYQRSTDAGKTFTAPVLLGEGGDNFGGATICYGNKGTQRIVNVISSNTGNRELYAYYSSDNGAHFSVSPIATYPSAKEAPVCAADRNGSVYVVWQDDRDGVVVNGLKRRDVHFARSSDSGKTWGSVKNLTNTPGAGSSDSSITLDLNGKLHVTYHDDKNDGNNSWEIYYTQSPDKGATWKTVQKLTATTPTTGVNIDVPSIAVSRDGKVHIVWQDQRNGYFQIFHKRGDGTTWEPETAISGDIRGSLGPSIDASNIDNSVHVLWSGAGTGNARDVFYRKSK